MQQEHSEGHHVVPVRTYLIIFGILMVLAVITVAVSYVNLGVLNNFIAMAIAISKAALIMAFFMHLRYTNKLTLLVAMMGFFWLIIFLVITMGDYLARGSIPGDLGPQSVFEPWM